ncbi:membrane-anchored junction protein isoform X2 [Peromyscus californicus insignis]|uniref:membrane-anchored junction protein isoform X2 n=1 Tax=Peromyscus californicus insignis TaxID=564181 RepID=UPI0022A7A3FD|nr:membrane-anchored junction protein isoform X2 [Peromyscus californicus insignis]
MSLKPFTYPFPETRFLHAGPNVYKFKIRYGDSIRGEEIEDKEVIIQELEVLVEKKAEEATVRKRRLMEEPSSPSRPGPHRVKIETSSEALSNQKPPKETKRNREGEAQQEYQDTPASDATDVQEQDSKLGHSLPELVIPPLQHSNPPTPKEPGTSGFFGFLSTLLPFRYFFRKSWQ